MRLLEYSQRLSMRRRNLVVQERIPAVGTTLWLEAAQGGATALGRAMGAIASGQDHAAAEFRAAVAALLA